jgi:DNA mismatch endonuclease (patch repair protein)
VDPLSAKQRSAFMANIRGKNTRPELAVRRALHGLGYRFRVHYQNLPGRPDVAFPARQKAIFVHGCFWHHHPGCPFAHIPKTRSDYWTEKFSRNRERDAKNQTLAAQRGWRTLVVWECELHDSCRVVKRITRFLGPKQYPQNRA